MHGLCAICRSAPVISAVSGDASQSFEFAQNRQSDSGREKSDDLPELDFGPVIKEAQAEELKHLYQKAL